MENLYKLVDRLITSFLPAAVRNHNIFINEVPDDLPIEHNNEWVASIITGLIAIAAVNTSGNFIRFSAKKYEHLLVLEMQEFNKMPFNGELRQLQILAEKIGGSLSVTIQNPDKRITSFSFPNLPVVV
jgi:hypothetical protein